VKPRGLHLKEKQTSSSDLLPSSDICAFPRDQTVSLIAFFSPEGQRLEATAKAQRLRTRCRDSNHRRGRRVPGGQLVLLLAGPGPGHGGQVVDRAHAVDGGVELLQLLPDVVKLLGVRGQVAGVRLASFTAPFFTWTGKKGQKS